MRSPERFARILRATSDINAPEIHRVRHAEAIYLVSEEAMLSAASRTSSLEDRSLESELTALAALSIERDA